MSSAAAHAKRERLGVTVLGSVPTTRRANREGRHWAVHVTIDATERASGTRSTVSAFSRAGWILDRVRVEVFSVLASTG